MVSDGALPAHRSPDDANRGQVGKWAAGSSFAATLGRVAESMPGEVLSVDPLSQEDIKEFVQVMVGAKPDARLAARIYAQSCGNPLFALEAVESLASSGDLLTRRGYAFVRGIRGPVVVSRRGASCTGSSARASGPHR